MRNYIWVILVVVMLLLGPINHTQAIHVQQNNTKKQDPLVLNNNPDGFLPINYDIYKKYVNGSSIYSGSRNSLDTSKLQTDATPYPFISNRLTLGGSENVAYLDTNGFTMMQEIGTYPSAYYQAITDPSIRTTNPTQSSTNIAVGDVDGDHQPDIVMVYYSGSVVLRIYTHTAYYTIPLTMLLSTPSYVALAGAQFAPITNQEQLPQVTVGNFDNDPMDEFAVLCYDSNKVEQVLLFDDLLHSHTPQSIHYGDYITLSTFVNTISGNQPTDYVQSTGSTLTYASNDAYRTAHWIQNTTISADPSLRFRIVNPNDLSSSAQIGYGYPVGLQDQNGLYVNDNQGSVDLTPTLGSTAIFTIRDESLATDSNNAIYELNTVAFENYESPTIRTFLGVDTTSTFEGYTGIANPRIEYQIFHSDALLEHFVNYNSTYVGSISIPGISRTIPDTQNSADMDKGGSLNIISANIDADSRSEFVVAGLDANSHPVAYVYDDALANYAPLHIFQWSSLTDVFPNIAAGDMNGDGKDELIFGYSSQTSATLEVYSNLFQLLYSATGLSPTDYPTVQVGDIDNDGKAELLYLDHGSYLSVYDDQSNYFTPIVQNYFVFNTYDDPNSVFGDFGADDTARAQSFSTSFPQMTIGDYNIDGENEIAINVFSLDTNANQNYVTAIFSLTNVTNVLSLLDYRFENNINYNNLPIATLISGDFDVDSYTVEYTGNHTLFTTPGELSAIAVASPVQKRINQNYDDSNTLFGTSVSQSSTVDNEFSTSYGAFVKFEQEFGIFGIKFAQFETQAGFTHEMSLRNIQTVSTVTTTEFHGDAFDDTVIYTTAIYDTYSFKVVDSKYQGQIGRPFTVSIPNNPALYKQQKSYYNQNTGGGNSPINSTIIPSTAGNLSSYMSHDQLEQYIQTYATGTVLESSEVQIGQGEGYNTVKIDISKEDTTGFSQSYSFDFSISGGVFGLSLGFTFGLTTTHAYQTTIGQSTSFGLDVGDIITPEDYNDYHYGFGLAVYQVNINNHGVIQSPWVINSWITLPTTWRAPPLDSTTGSGNVGNASSSGLFGLPFNFLLFILAFIPIQLVNKRIKRNK